VGTIAVGFPGPTVSRNVSVFDARLSDRARFEELASELRPVQCRRNCSVRYCSRRSWSIFELNVPLFW
jgi:hypothetical protein